LWASIAGAYELRADEVSVLEQAAGEADLIAALKAGLVGEPQLVKGSQGQQVIHPIIAELRQHRATYAALLRQLKLPDVNPEQAAGDRSTAARAAANARWSQRGA
jgi:hypothetical protein